jgi:hypothetical protein
VKGVLEDIRKAVWFDTVDQYLENAIVSRVQADIDGEVFNLTVKAVAERYTLKEEFDIKEADAE